MLAEWSDSYVDALFSEGRGHEPRPVLFPTQGARDIGRQWFISHIPGNISVRDGPDERSLIVNCGAPEMKRLWRETARCGGRLLFPGALPESGTP